MKSRSLLVAALALAILPVLASCAQVDVVGNTSVVSFAAVLAAAPDQVSADDANGGWSLSAPDGSAQFIWSKDYGSSPGYDVMLELDAQPFVDAGLDAGKLPQGMFADDKIRVGTELGDESLTYAGEATPLASYEQIVKLKRDHVKYHTALDHYGVDLANGNVFEWAKDMSKNDKDIVFVLNPQPFLDAGVDPASVEGWVFAKVNVEDANGKPIEVDKFLKPFDLQ